jgi:transcription-repair coupling factor (superfamily II helicase)
MDQIIAQVFSQVAKSSSAQISAKAPLFVELFASHAAKIRQIVLITKNGADFIVRLKNLRFFLEDQATILRSLPNDDRTIMHATSADPLIRMERTATRFSIAIGEQADIVLMAPEALLERCPTSTDLQKHAHVLSLGDKVDREMLIRSLLLQGYSKVPHVVDRGTFALRGSIIDIFVNGEKKPIRLDLFGDDIESIKYFDENTQRSLQSIESIIIGPVKEVFLDDDAIALSHTKLRNLADVLNYPTQKLNEKLRDIENGIHFYGMEKLIPAFFTTLSSILELLLGTNTKQALPLIIFDDKEGIIAELKNLEMSNDKLYEQAIARGDLIFGKDEYFLDLKALFALLEQFASIDIAPFNKASTTIYPCHETNDIRQEILKASIATTKDDQPHLLKPLADRVKRLHGDKFTTIITVSSRDHEQELKKLLEAFHINTARLDNKIFLTNALPHYQPHIHAYIKSSRNPLAFGGVFDFLRMALIAEDDIFGKRTKRKDVSGKHSGFSTSVSDLELNDLVVHVDHGVGQFKGLVRLNVRGVENDYVLLTYAHDEKLYLPTYRINLIKPHGGHKEGVIRVDKLGGNAWMSKKNKVKEAVMAMAQDLLKLYAKRELVLRPPFIEPDAHYLEFEANFEFETTHDQQKAIDDVIADLRKNRPMDRLVCGDVGYGKTEVAMRASMLAALSNRQVAILAPTTVLAQQHGITFNERFKNTGVTIAVLSRFQKPRDIKNVLDALQKNKIDIVIGTHRLLSPDVEFHDLGLIVIDEEQRFGIKAKEHLKKMRTKVDVLAMSATPIPRTMQMSYFGIRDLSIIETPPIDRRAIETQVVQFDDAVIKEAIMRELSRKGQVYFVHNRVQSITAIAEYLRSLVPKARIAVAHGQMSESDLENIMLRFMTHEINLLVCTTIIETGIDVSSANTMFINDADDFGLSQLYQLRGRIGRSKERAFAYLLVKQETEHLTPIARTRLSILHKFSELGAGFRIAQHDLEIRGAGDLLGKNQHGHMAAVGYDLYAELLRNAVKELKGQTEQEEIDPEVILPMSALISEKYCPDLHERMSFYQRLASADTKDKIEAIIADLEDLYGEVPKEVRALQVSAIIKLALKKIRAIRLELARSKDDHFVVVSITLFRTALIDHQKLASAREESSQLRITPQHKVIQSFKTDAVDDYENAQRICLMAIERVQKDLLIHR